MLVQGFESKARVGADAPFIWNGGDLPCTAAPSLVVRLPAGDSAPIALSAVLPQTTITAISADRTVLTASAPVADADGVAGRFGDAWLISETAGFESVRIREVSGSTITLAAAPVMSPDLTGGALTIVSKQWFATLTAADITGTAARNVVWRLTWTPDAGADAPTDEQVAEGVLHIVAQPFRTGVTSTHVEQVAPTLRGKSPRGQVGWQDQIDAALGELVDTLRSDLAESGKYEDDILGANRSALSRVHAMMAAHYALVAVDDLAKAEMMAAKVWGPRDLGATNLFQGGGMYDRALRRILIDIDGDRKADDGDEQQVSGPRVSSLGAFSSSDAPSFTRNSRTSF